MRTSFLRTSSPLALLLFVATACGASTGSAPATNTPASTEAPAAEEKVVGPPDVKWADMEPMQKGKFMKAVVTPRMKELFVAFDAKEFAEFDCGTCHGKDAKEREFKMPNPGLPVLPGDEAGFAKLAQEHPDDMKFMAEQVKPEMAKLLGLPEFDPKNAAAGGFSCGNCHTNEKK